MKNYKRLIYLRRAGLSTKKALLIVGAMQGGIRV